MKVFQLWPAAIPLIVLMSLNRPALAAEGTPAPGPTPLAQDYTVVYHNTVPETYIEGPGLERFDDGTLLAVVPVVPQAEFSRERRLGGSTTHILDSTDGGKTWNKLSELPYYSAAPFTYKGVLYLFAITPGPNFRNDDLLLLTSPDRGRTWSAPVTLFTGHFWNCHTGMVIRDGKIYWAVDDLSFGSEKRGPVAIVGDLADPMNPASWKKSNSIPFSGVPAELTNPEFASLESIWLEPNVIDVNGKIRILAVVKPRRQTTAGLCAVFDVKEEGNALKLTFVQFSPMPGGQLKFCVLWDEVSKMFWATSNLVIDSQGRFEWWKTIKKAKSNKYGGNDRRLLVLQYGLDGLNWFQAGLIARADKASQSFMYARPVIDGDDLAIICRSSIDAPNQHDADYATFHRVKNFRHLAYQILPDREE